MRSPFGQLDGRNLDIAALARKIGRTPSALAMKACNFASLDPVFRSSQRKGLSGASQADRAIWNEFTANPEKVAAEAEEHFSRTDTGAMERNELIPVAPAGDTEIGRIIRARRVQSFFRAAVLTSYEGQCALSGIAVPDILVASHIIPWSESVERRADPTNGICLNALFDRAFDRGLLTFDENHRAIVSRRLRSAAARADLSCSIVETHGRPLRLPRRLSPDPTALAHHRERIFSD